MLGICLSESVLDSSFFLDSAAFSFALLIAVCHDLDVTEGSVTRVDVLLSCAPRKASLQSVVEEKERDRGKKYSKGIQ